MGRTTTIGSAAERRPRSRAGRRRSPVSPQPKAASFSSLLRVVSDRNRRVNHRAVFGGGVCCEPRAVRLEHQHTHTSYKPAKCDPPPPDVGTRLREVHTAYLSIGLRVVYVVYVLSKMEKLELAGEFYRVREGVKSRSSIASRCPPDATLPSSPSFSITSASSGVPFWSQQSTGVVVHGQFRRIVVFTQLSANFANASKFNFLVVQ